MNVAWVWASANGSEHQRVRERGGERVLNRQRGRVSEWA